MRAGGKRLLVVDVFVLVRLALAQCSVDLGFFGAAAAAAAAGRGLAAAVALAFAFAAASAAFFLACVCSNVSKIESLVRGCFFPGRSIALFFMMEPSGIL